MNLRNRLVIDELARHRAQFEGFCRSLSKEELATAIPDSHWTVRDYIVHLCTIDSLIAAAWRPRTGLSQSEPVVSIRGPFDIDEWNDDAVRARPQASLDDLFAEGARHREAMVEAIEQFDDADLDREISYGGDRKTLALKPSQVRFGGLLWAIAVHDPTHTRDILRALPHRKDDPAVREWFGSVNESMIPQGVREQRV